MEEFHLVSLWIFTLCFSFIEGSFVVDVTQSSYQAEENHNITLEWTFTTKPDTSISALRIRCRLKTDQKYLTLYYLYNGIEFSKDEEFSGRVQSDKDALREGRIRLQLSRLRTEDSGLYLCEVDTGYGHGYSSCRVTVSEPQSVATETSQPPRIIQTPDVNKETKVTGKVWTGLIAAVVVVCFLLILMSFVVLRCKERCLNRVTPPHTQ